MPQSFINPNYLNTYPNAYPYQPQMQPPMDRLQQLQAPYQMPQQTQVSQVPQTNQGILWVQGEAGAKSCYRSGGKDEDCKRRMLAALEEHMDELTEELGEMSKDADCREERETMKRYIEKLRNMM